MKEILWGFTMVGTLVVAAPLHAQSLSEAPEPALVFLTRPSVSQEQTAVTPWLGVGAAGIRGTF